MGVSDAYAVAKDFGFPAFLVVLLLWRLDQRLMQLAGAVHALAIAMQRHGVDVPPPLSSPPAPR
jgi:hypothetical protein